MFILVWEQSWTIQFTDIHDNVLYILDLNTNFMALNFEGREI